MPSLHSSLKHNEGMYGVAVVGFEEVYRALKGIEGDLPKQVRKNLRLIGKIVKDQAEANAGNIRKSGALAGSIKVSLSPKAASVFSTAPHGGVQNVGGGPHAGWSARGPHVKRANASHYMNKAVDSTRGEVQQAMEELMQWVASELAKG